MAKYYIGSQSFGHDDSDYLMHYGRKGMKWGKNIFEKDILGSVKKAGANAGNFLTNAGKSGVASVQKWASSAKKSVSKAVNTPVFGKKQVPVYSHNEGRTQPKGTKYGQPITKTVPAKSVADVANDVGKSVRNAVQSSAPYQALKEDRERYEYFDDKVRKAKAKKDIAEATVDEDREIYKKRTDQYNDATKRREKKYEGKEIPYPAFTNASHAPRAQASIEYTVSRNKALEAERDVETYEYNRDKTLTAKVKKAQSQISQKVSDIKSSGAKAINSGKSYAESILGKASKTADSAKKSVSKTASDISKKASKAVSKAKSAASSTVSSIKSSGVKAINSGKNFISGLFGKKHSGGGRKF